MERSAYDELRYDGLPGDGRDACTANEWSRAQDSAFGHERSKQGGKCVPGSLLPHVATHSTGCSEHAEPLMAPPEQQQPKFDPHPHQAALQPNRCRQMQILFLTTLALTLGESSWNGALQYLTPAGGSLTAATGLPASQVGLCPMLCSIPQPRP